MRHLLCCLCLLVLARAVRADYPTPQAAGFHHCALIYESSTRGPAELTPYVADGRGWLFDSFLFLRYATSKGVSCSDGETRLADWQEQLDTWFAPGRDLAALDAAIDQAAEWLGSAPLPRTVMFSVSYPNLGVKDFGDVDGDGISEDLSAPQGQEEVARWYVSEIQRRFAAAHYRHLRLWGLYWMREDVPEEDADVVTRFARAVHDAGLCFSWIPWYHAPGWQRWKALGFDVAIMQPNYAFLDTHHASVRRNRLAICASDARAHGLGVEIELPMNLGIPGSPRLFREYLRDGAAGRYGYQQAATAYYLGTSVVEQLARSHDPLYTDLAAYIHGDTLPEPDLPVRWEVTGKPAPWLGDQRLTPGRPVANAQATLPLQPLEALDVFLDEPEKHWTGLVSVEGRRTAGKPWEAAGWARRTGPQAQDGRYQVVTVPLTGSWSALRVRFEGERVPMVAELTPQPPTLGGLSPHLAYRARYTVSPPERAHYGDTGYELTDGVIPDTGFPSGRTVGWIGTPVAVSFDLGKPVEVTRAEVHLQGGSGAAVYWPRTAQLLLSTGYPPPGRTEGLGAPPLGLAAVSPGKVVIDRTRSATDQDGHVPFPLPRPVRARYATFLFEPQGWLMLSEIRLFSGRLNLLAGRPYRLQPSPTPVQEGHGYPDDGRLLTDGVIAQSFGSGQTYGWADGRERTIEVDLGRLCSANEVVVWSLTGSRAGIFLPASVKITVSEDGQTWRDLGVATPTQVPEEPPTPCPFTVKAKKQSVCYVRVVVAPTKGWSMLSEIQVAGESQ
jgi:hypothetical protein